MEQDFHSESAEGRRCAHDDRSAPPPSGSADKIGTTSTGTRGRGALLIPDLGNEERAAPRTPEQTAHHFVAAWNTHDAEALASLFVHDADFINVVGLRWESRDSIRTAHEYGFRKIFAGSKMTLEELTVRRTGPQTAVVVWAWTLSGQQSAQGGQAETRRGRFMFVVVQREGGWEAVAAQNTDRVPGAETNTNRGGDLQPETYQKSAD